MEHIAVWQIALLTLYSGLAIYDGNNTTLGLVKPSMGRVRQGGVNSVVAFRSGNVPVMR